MQLYVTCVLTEHQLTKQGLLTICSYALSISCKLKHAEELRSNLRQVCCWSCHCHEPDAVQRSKCAGVYMSTSPLSTAKQCCTIGGTGC
jgi:hypothetical protein